MPNGIELDGLRAGVGRTGIQTKTKPSSAGLKVFSNPVNGAGRQQWPMQALVLFFRKIDVFPADPRLYARGSPQRSRRADTEALAELGAGRLVGASRLVGAGRLVGASRAWRRQAGWR